ncbi:MAG TPA: MFS transporter [Steroidobacteraceae bacterium]|nr:MFS transporter [Steroidobacteraceae bacterium]
MSNQAPGHKFFYGWVIVATAVLGIACSFSVLVLTMTSLYAAPLIKEFGWSSSQIFFGSFLAGIGGVLTAPFIGAISDRLGVRSVLFFSFLFEVLILFSYRFLSSDVTGYYIRYSLLAVLCMGTTQVVFNRIISAWFNKRLGLALGIAMAGVGVGGVFWSLVIPRLVEHEGWRNAYTGMALIIGCVTLPLVVLLTRANPLSKGQNVDGALTANAHEHTLEQEKQGMTLGEAASTGQYWLMIVVFMLVGTGLQSVQTQLVPLLLSRGSTALFAANVQASLAFAVICGRVLSGLLLDYFFAARVAQVFLIAPIVGTAALILGVSGAPAFVAAMGIGLAVGGESDVVAYLVRRYFGMKQYSRIYGSFFSAYGTASAVGPFLTAWGHERVAGGYGTVLWVHVGLLALAIALLFGYRRYSLDREPVGAATP